MSPIVLFMMCLIFQLQSKKLMRQQATITADGSAALEGRGPVGIDFGGAMHGTDSTGRLERPEFVKSEACTQTKCEDCADSTASGCWHGATHTTGGYSWMQVHVNANDPKDHYVLEVFVACSGSSASSVTKVFPKEIVNADVKVYLDGVFKKTFQDADSACSSNCETKYGKYGFHGSALDLNIASGQKGRVRIALKRKNPWFSARAKIGIFAFDVDHSVDQCLASQECLSVLGDGTAGSFELRNSNIKQRDCLSGASESSTCTKWKVCLPDAQEKKLLAFLRASLRASTLEEVGVVARSRKTNQVECMDPSSTDPESWECECVDMIVEKCGSAEDEECMFNTMCEHADVCSEWKTASNCPASLEQNAAAMSTRSANISLLHTGLDNTLQGKCSQ